MSVAGGVAGALVLVAAWMSYSIWTEDDNLVADLESAQATAKTLNAAPVAPTAAARSAIDANAAKVEAWTADAFALVARGDIAIDAGVSPERFKQAMLKEARSMAALPGSADGKIVKADFGFGYPDFITGGAMPEKAKLAEMQRRWEDVKFIFATIASAGATEILEISPAEEQKKQEPQTKRGAAAKREAEKRQAAEASAPKSFRYDVKFLAKPAALVKAFNLFASSERFAVVDAFSFAKESDTLLEKLEGVAHPGAASGRGGVRGTARKPQPRAVEEKKGLVTDPSLDIPFTVSVGVTVFDFGTAGRGGGK